MSLNLLQKYSLSIDVYLQLFKSSVMTLAHILTLWQVASKKLTLKKVTNYIADVICKRADLGYNYGVILIPEGLIDFIPEVMPESIFVINLASIVG